VGTLVKRRPLALSFALAGAQHDECVCCLAAMILPRGWIPSPAPDSRGPPRPASCPGLSSFKTLHDYSSPSNASGLVSNAFRRNAAHIFGKHATPASFFTISGRGYSSAFPLSFDSPQALKKLAAPLSQFDAPPCSRSLGIRHEFTLGLVSQ